MHSEVSNHLFIIYLTLCRISYHLLQEPCTLHNAVKSDALLARNLNRARFYGVIVQFVVLDNGIQWQDIVL